MSCGTPHATDCREVLHAVYLYLDGEIDIEQRRLNREHLDECAPCLRQFGVEQEVKVLVARHCGGDRAPDSLRISVLERLRLVQIGVDAVEYRVE